MNPFCWSHVNVVADKASEKMALKAHFLKIFHYKAGFKSQ